MFKKTALLVLVVLALLLACAPKERVLNVVVSPAEDEVSTREKYQPFVDYIEEGIGMEINLITPTDYTTTVEAMKYGHGDVARFGPLNYVQATEEAEVEPLVGALRSGKAFYNALIISRPDLETLEGATFAYVDPGSTSGYGVPSIYIRDNNIELGQILFAGSHNAVIEAVKNGSVDAGAVSDSRWFIALEEGVVTTDTVKVFATSEPIPNSLWAVQSDMDPELREALLITFLGMPEKIVIAIGTGDTRFVVVQDEDYDIIRKVWEAMD